MAVTRPYRRTVRQFVSGGYKEGGRSCLVVHPAYAADAAHYVRGFEVIQKDLVGLFDYLEPADKNRNAYSFRTLELLVRASIEVEANLAAILTANGYPKQRLTMRDYVLVEDSHRLSAYRVALPRWSGVHGVWQPFSNWKKPLSGRRPPSWFKVYHATKHDRAKNFARATFEAALNAVAALVVLLSAQFLDEQFDGQPDRIVSGHGSPVESGMESATGGVFQVRYPDDWPIDERYDFDHVYLCKLADPFLSFPYV